MNNDTSSHSPNEDELNEKQHAALEYLRRGIATVPCRGKSPFTKDWNNQPRPSKEELIAAFADPTLNIGARLGSVSGGLIDVDIDSAVAAHIASRFLPRTGAVYGRQSRPSSHWQYFERDRSSVFPSVFKGPDGRIVLEIRGEYRQSIVPPSTHVDTGEAIEWAGDGLPGEPAVISYQELHRWCGYLSATVIIAEILATRPGQRHSIVLHLAGGFATHNLPRDIAERIIDEAASWANADVDDLLKAVASTYDSVDAGIEEVTGFQSLFSTLGRATVALIRQYTGTEVKDDRAIVRMTVDNVNTIGDAVINQMQKRNDPPTVFTDTEGEPVSVRVTDDGSVKIDHFNDDQWREVIMRRIKFEVPGKKTAKDADPEPVEKSAPMDVVRNTRGRRNLPFPRLARIGYTPTFAADGTLRTEQGYDPKTFTYVHALGGVNFNDSILQLPPTKDELKRAVDLLNELLTDFPFAGPADRANTIAAFLQQAGRQLIPGRIPLIGIGKPAPGTGASLLVRSLTAPFTGPEGVIAMTQPKDDEEWKKELLALHFQGQRYAFLDNVNRRLDSGTLAAALTSGRLSIRQLGSNRTVDALMPDFWFMTGNNPAVSNEIARRIVPIRIDAHMDRPFDRKGFRHELPSWAYEYRVSLVHAALSIWKAWLNEGRPSGSVTLGGYEGWAKTMGGILDVAGIPGFLTNMDDFYEAADVEGGFWRALIDAWWEVYGSTDVTVRDLFRLPVAEESPLIAAGNIEKAKQSFGMKLRAQQDRWYGDKRVRKAGLNRDKVQTYALVDRNGETRPRQEPEGRTPFGRPRDLIDLGSVRKGRT